LTIFGNKFYTKFKENVTNGLDSDTRSRKNEQRDMTPCKSFLSCTLLRPPNSNDGGKHNFI